MVRSQLLQQFLVFFEHPLHAVSERRDLIDVDSVVLGVAHVDLPFQKTKLFDGMHNPHLIVFLKFNLKPFIIFQRQELFDYSAIPNLPAHQQIIHELGYHELLCGYVVRVSLLEPVAL